LGEFFLSFFCFFVFLFFYTNDPTSLLLSKKRPSNAQLLIYPDIPGLQLDI